ncbi:MAG: Txe/YoeB family addiction module toxin [Oscillospiraceae bacterium]|nr:Txe/YoeB family addiction module toxin [Oscillospiraceae bacterium]
MYDVFFVKQARKDAEKIERAGLKPKVVAILRTVRKNPYEKTQGFEKLTGDLKGAYSRRISRQHRFLYSILPNVNNAKDDDGNVYEGIVKVISMWTHYE